MAKISLVSFLALLCLLLVKANINALRSTAGDEAFVVKEKKTGKVVSLPSAHRFNPVVPRVLPDLYNGYLFNTDRHLEGGAQGVVDSRDEAPQVNIYELSYDGSFIYGAIKKGLVSYPLQKISRSKRTSLGKRRAPQRASLQLGEGDKIGGYNVTAIEVDKIIFSRGGEEVVKTLHDQEKIRSSGRMQLTARSKPLRSGAKIPTPRRATPPRFTRGGER